MTHTHTPPRHTVPQELSWLLLGCIRGSGKGPGCVCSRRAVPLPGSDPAAGGAKGPPPAQWVLGDGARSALAAH